MAKRVGYICAEIRHDGSVEFMMSQCPPRIMLKHAREDMAEAQKAWPRVRWRVVRLLVEEVRRG